MRRVYGALTPAKEAHQNRTNRTLGQSTADSSVLTEGRGNLARITTTGSSPKSIPQAKGGRAANGNVYHKQRTKFVLAAATTTIASRGHSQRCNRSTHAVIYDGRATADNVASTSPAQYRSQNGSRSSRYRRNRCRFVISVCSVPCSGHHLPSDSGSTRNPYGKRRPRAATPLSPNNPRPS